MNAAECDRELEVLEAVTSGRWPEGIGAELREHVDRCLACKDVTLLATTFREDRSAALLAARIPSAGLVWWRSEMKARRDALNKATRPIRIVEWVATACALAAAVGLLGWLGLPALAAMLWQPSLTFFLGLGALAILTPLALYFVFSRD